MEEKKFENMSNEELNRALYEKLSAEQDNYRNWLESQTAAEALNHAYEYVVRQDILYALEGNDLPTAQVKALLQNSCTLNELYEDWRDIETDYMQDIRNTIEERADIFIRQEQEKLMQFAGVPVYNQTYEFAKEHNEMDLYLQSHKADVACGGAIEEAIRQNYLDNSLAADKAMEGLVPRFGMERINFVLANMVRHLAWDGRISPQNKEWAKTVPAPVNYERSQKFMAFSVHPGLLDMFASSVRKFEPEQNKEPEKAKPSVLAQLHQSKSPVKPVPNKKAKGQEL